MQDSQQQFAALVAPHLTALYRAAYRLTRQAPDAEDLVQDVCLRAFARLETLQALDSARSWLLRVQYRIFVDGDRRRRRSPVREIGTDTETGDALACLSPGPEEMAEAVSLRRRLDAAWQRLSADQRALLALHAEGYGLGELEQITGKGRAALSARLHRARRRLAQLLGIQAALSGQANPRVNENEV